MHSIFRCVFAGTVAMVFCALCEAGQSTPQPQPNASEGRRPRGAPILNDANPGAGGDSMIEEMMRKVHALPQDKVERGELVNKAQAAICPICNHGLFKHADPNWEGCVPMDEEGNPRKMQRIISVPAVDPISGITFTAALPGNFNDRGGRDRDNCIHSVGKTVVHSTVWVSPDSGYAAVIPADKRGESFQLGLDGKPLSPEIASFIREKLQPEMEKRMKRILGLREERPVPDNLKPLSQFVLQPQIPDWIKYDNALQIYEKMKPPHAFMARLYYEAAHACRREISSEVAAPALDPALQESLSRGIQRVNYYLLGETMNIRRERGAPIVDPKKAETDPQIISMAAERILAAGKRLGVRPQDRTGAQIEAPAPQQNYFTTADMFLANIILAGAQNRLGNAAAAEKSLNDALVYVPEQLSRQVENPDFEQRIRQQLKMLRSIVFDRLNCLKKEQEWLYKSAQRNMAAAKFDELKFRNYKDGFKPGEASKSWDPALFSYLTGELLRRSGEDAGALAWFNAAEQMIEKSLENIDAAEKANPPPPAPVVALPNTPAPENPYERERALMVTLKMWTREQRKLLRKSKPAEAIFGEVVSKVLEKAGMPAKVPPARIVDAPGAESAPSTPAAVNAQGTPPSAPSHPATGDVHTPQTRDELFKTLFLAISAYRKDKKENPTRLSDLVQNGYLTPAQSCLNEKGELFCPETKDRLLYMKNWQPGDATYPMILKVGSKSLYADGSIRVHK